MHNQGQYLYWIVIFYIRTISRAILIGTGLLWSITSYLFTAKDFSGCFKSRTNSTSLEDTTCYLQEAQSTCPLSCPHMQWRHHCLPGSWYGFNTKSTRLWLSVYLFHIIPLAMMRWDTHGHFFKKYTSSSTENEKNKREILAKHSEYLVSYHFVHKKYNTVMFHPERFIRSLLPGLSPTGHLKEGITRSVTHWWAP